MLNEGELFTNILLIIIIFLSHPEDRELYSATKEALTKNSPNGIITMKEYRLGKTDVINRISAKANLWKSSQQTQL